jgi:serine phosphatase RsbU (regulator of sigma subunit)
MEDGLSLSINIAVAKTNKYASRDSGDTVELAERPGGGMSVVIVDGQGSGIGAKTLSMQLTSKAVSLLKEGVRDGAVARAVHDSLFAFRRGQVSAALDILSVDLKTRSVLITRNSETPMTMCLQGEWKTVPPTSGPIGLYHFTRPSVNQLQAEAGLTVILTSDGVPGAGERGGNGKFEIAEFAPKSDGCDLAADELADRVLREAIDRDQGRPRDDLSVVVLSLTGHVVEPLIRRMSVFVPLP